MFALILRVAAFVCFAIAGFFSSPSAPYYNRLIAIGLACWVLSDLVSGVGPGVHS